jgi:hypothetical protein
MPKYSHLVHKSVRSLGIAVALLPLAACGTDRATSPSNPLRAVNRCLSRRHLRVRTTGRAYVSRKGEPGRVTRWEKVDYTVPASTIPGNPPATIPSSPGEAALVVQLISAQAAQAYAAYWQRATQGSLPGTSASQLAGASGLVAWVRDTGSKTPGRAVAACVTGQR